MAGSLNNVRAKPHPLAQTLGKAAAEISGPVSEVDGIERVGDPGLRVAQAVETGEVLQVLGDREAQVETRRFGHDRRRAGGSPPRSPG